MKAAIRVRTYHHSRLLSRHLRLALAQKAGLLLLDLGQGERPAVHQDNMGQ